jgi:hypothetical protein
MSKRRDRTIGDVITAAVRQGRELDFRFVPLTAAERRKGSKRTGAEAFEPILEQLGLLTEAEMAQVKEKRTKAELVGDLAIAREEIAELRAQLVAAQREPPIAEQVERAARVLATQFADSVGRRAPGDTEMMKVENREAMARVLRRLARSHRFLFVLAEVGEATHGVVGAIGDPVTDQDFCRVVDLARETSARQIVMKHGAADSLALVRRAGAGEMGVCAEVPI